MKKKIYEIFDEIKPEELDQFSDALNAPELPPEVLAAVKDKVYAKTGIRKEKKTAKSVWIRFGAVAACFVLIVSAIFLVPIFKGKESGRTGDPAPTPQETLSSGHENKEKPIFYMQIAAEEIEGTEGWADPSAPFSDFAPVSETNIHFQEKKSFFDESAAREKFITVGKDTHRLVYSRSAYASENPSESESSLPFPYGNFDMYKMDGVRAEFFRGTDQLAYLFIPSEHRTGKMLTEEELRAIADDFLLSVVPAEEFGKYRYEGFTDPTKSDNGTEFDYFFVEYCRYVGAYKTADRLSVGINVTGEIFGYTGNRYKMADVIEKAVSKTDIEKTVGLLQAEIEKRMSGDFEIDEFTICTNTEGDIFLCTGVKYTMEDGMTSAVEVVARIIPAAIRK